MSIIGVYIDPRPIAINYMSIASYTGVAADWIIPDSLYNTSAGKTASVFSSTKIFVAVSVKAIFTKH